jgi:hypothetical protein
VSVKVDISDVIRGTATASTLLTNWPRTVEDTLRIAAQTEKRESTYKNQTGHLRQGTRAATISQTDNEIVVDLEMAEPYASFVVKNGYSKFPKGAKAAERKLDREAKAIERKTGKL